MRRIPISILFLFYFFFVFSVLADPPSKRVITLAVRSDIKIEGVEYDIIKKSIRNACKNWEKSGAVKFVYNKNPHILVTSQEEYKEDVVGYHQNGKVVIISKIYPKISARGWDEEFLSRIITHEIGHYLFGNGHSSDPNDIMYYRPLVNTPSLKELQYLRNKINKNEKPNRKYIKVGYTN